LLEAIARLANRIADFAGLSFSADTQDQAVQAFQSDVDSRMAVITNRTLFFSLWWKGLEEAEAERLMAVSGDYRYWLEEMRHFKPHTLTEAEEKVINIKDVTGSRAIVNLYNTLTNRYIFRLDVDGEIKEFTRGELMVYVRSYDPVMRARAYQELYRVYGQDGTILGQMLVLSLYQQYKVEGDAFKPRYLGLLSAGGSKSPGKILSDAGINMHNASFWQGGFDVIRGFVEQLETIPVVK
jgi:oligoendopeptidase F